MKKRWALRICLFVLLGAIVNVAVAWGLAAWSSWSGETSTRPLNDDERIWLRANGESPAGAMIETRGIGRTLRDCYLADSEWNQDPKSSALPGRPFEVIAYATGFPLRGLGCEIWFHSREWQAAHGRSPRVNGPPDFVCVLNAGSKYLPLRPIWPGFAINTVFYTAILWLLFAAPFALRRWRRRKRGLCPACGYDLRGRPPNSGSQACPECGKAVTLGSVNPALRCEKAS